MSKLEAVEKRCKAVNSKIQTRIVQADFSNVSGAGRAKEAEVLAFYENEILKKVEDLDIAILVNNAGVMYTGRFDETKPDSPRWKEIIDVNVMHVGVMT